jgi:hypothetical protein
MSKKTKQTAVRFSLRNILDVDLIPDDKAVELARELGFAAELPRSDKDRAILWTAIGMELAKEKIGRRKRQRPLIWDQKKRDDLSLDIVDVYKDWWSKPKPPSALWLARELCRLMPEKYGRYAVTDKSNNPDKKLKNFAEKYVLPARSYIMKIVVQIASQKASGI